MVEAFVSNLEAQTRCQLGQGKEEREIVKWSMHKILKDCQLKLTSEIREQEKLREALKAQVGPKSAKYKIQKAQIYPQQGGPGSK